MALLKFSKEERQLLQSVDAVIDIPKNTPARVARRFYEQTKRLIAQLRGLAPVLESRGLAHVIPTKSRTVADARALLSKYKVSAEDLIPRRRVYSDSTALEDACLQLRAAAYARQGGAFGVTAGAGLAATYKTKRDGGQSADPTASLRDDACDASTKEEHQQAAAYHRAKASKAPSMEKGIEQFKAADAHALAAQSGSAIDSCNARIASRLLREPGL